jgi:hypothetical protein
VLVGQALGTLAGFVGENTRLVQILIVGAVGLAGAVVAVNAATRAYGATHRALSAVMRVSTGDTIRHRAATIASTAASGIARGATLAWAAGQRILNLALRANPIGIVITVVAALVGLIIAAYKSSETFRGIVQKAGEVARTAFGVIFRVVFPIVGIIQAIVAGVQALVRWIRNIRWPEPPGWLKSVGSAIGGLFGASENPGFYEPGSPAPFHTSPATGRRWSFMPHTGGGGSGSTLAQLAALGTHGGLTIINVNGALDPDAVARQIERLLARRGTRTGRGVVTRQVTA